MNKKALWYLLSSAIVTLMVLYICDQIFMMNYIAKSTVKIILFTFFPLIYIVKADHNIFKDSILNLWRREEDDIRLNEGLILGLLMFAIIIGVFIAVRNHIDTDLLRTEFETKYKINRQNIVYYGAYLIFVNAFLEEFFFRGFIFLNIKRLGHKRLAYVFSAGMFAVYHISNFQNWVSVGLIIAALIGLFIGGCIFNYLDDHKETFLNSWLTHMCADLAIVLIGMFLI